MDNVFISSNQSLDFFLIALKCLATHYRRAAQNFLVGVPRIPDIKVQGIYCFCPESLVPMTLTRPIL